MKQICYLVLFCTLSFLPAVAQTDSLRINKIQVIGSHNSYKLPIDPALFKIFTQTDSVSASKIDYGHISFTEQLDFGLRNLEIDIYADAKGGKYASPQGLNWAKNQALFDPGGEMKAPGFKMLHIPDLDFRSNVLTLQSGLTELKEWSKSNPNHTPVFITLEAKDDTIKRPGLTQPEKFNSQTFDELDRMIVNYLGRENLIVPEQVKGKFKTLEEAVLKGNWPTLKSARGKLIFVLDAKGEKMRSYSDGHPSLEGRILFINADPGTAEAAIIISNNSKSSQIPLLVKKGYIVRTRADSDTKQARENDRSYFDAACNSGAQIITTDYYQKSKQFKSDYFVSFEGGTYFRMNPIFKNLSTSK